LRGWSRARREVGIMPQLSRPPGRRISLSRVLVPTLLLIMLAVMIVRDILVRRWSRRSPA
jgi:hypothetical protein